MPRRSPTISLIAVGGLVACIALVTLVIDSPRSLPGVALGSELILAVERILALFAGWMAIVVVVARALRGELPTEVSGRGLRYADANAAEQNVKEARAALRVLELEVDALRSQVLDLQGIASCCHSRYNV